MRQRIFWSVVSIAFPPGTEWDEHSHYHPGNCPPAPSRTPPPHTASAGNTAPPSIRRPRHGGTPPGRDAFEGKGPQRRPQKPLDGRVGGGYCRLQMRLSLALAIRETVAGHRVGALDGGGGVYQHAERWSNWASCKRKRGETWGVGPGP